MRRHRNITVAIDEQDYTSIRIWCAMRNVSISRVVQTFLKDLPHLQKVRRFPLPEAPQPGSLGEIFDESQTEEFQRVKRMIEASGYPTPLGL